MGSDTTLEAGDFAAFFEELWGYEPFPWQVRLAHRVCGPHDAAPWPDLLDLPTGSGKTSAIDVAVFWMAVDAARPMAQRRAPRRIVLVVDRRVVVDQAYERARTIAEALEASAERPICAKVGGALRRLGGVPAGTAALQAAVLRGGMIRDDAWVHYPDRPLVAASTVDQVGSRLLFRGYGVSRGMAPVHAGLLGNDVLYLLDEVHLSKPFAQTLGAIRRHFRGGELPRVERFYVVPMSATAGDGGDDIHRLDDEDHRHPVLQQRWLAPKPTQLDVVKVGARDTSPTISDKVAASTAAHASRLVEGGLRRVAVIVNRVATAREAHRLLVARGTSAVLLTGRMRPFDKDTRVREVTDRLSTDRTPGEDPVVVVATQCIEAGADFDFDGMVSECASLDALRQRFGRLNRRGGYPDAQARIVVRSDQRTSRTPDPVYGSALAATWSWLSSLEDLDFGLAVMDRRLEEPDVEPSDLVVATGSAPVLLRAHLDLWSQTSAAVFPDPEIALWLHGPERSQPELQIVWRADVPAGALAGRSPELASGLVERLAATPPGSLEALPVPLWAAQRWLSGDAETPVSDVLSTLEPSERPPGGGQQRFALRWAGERSRIVSPSELRPGDTVIVPSDYGGLSHGCWDPGAQVPVSDLGDRVQLVLRGRASVRLVGRGSAPVWVAPEAPASEVAPLVDIDPPDDEARDRHDQALRAMAQLLDTDEPWTTIAKGLLETTVDLVQLPPLGETESGRWREHMPGYWLAQKRGKLLSADQLRGLGGSSLADEASTEGDDGSFIESALGLRAHLSHVGTWAERFAERVGLPASLVGDLCLAGWLHDLGKADPRFQRMLHGGSQVSWANAPELLAKSHLSWRDRALRVQAQERSGYPQGTRHELMSVALVEDRPELRDRAHDWELVLHLVASHHGWCRPFPPAVGEEPPGASVAVTADLDGSEMDLTGSSAHGLARIDSGIPRRFVMLQRRYGWWGLAWLEALLRLADHRASEHQSPPITEEAL